MFLWLQTGLWPLQKNGDHFTGAIQVKISIFLTAALRLLSGDERGEAGKKNELGSHGVSKARRRTAVGGKSV